MKDEYGQPMKHLLPVATILVLATSGAAGQSRPDFSGRWSMDLARSEAAAQGPTIGPVEVAITQIADEVQIATTRNGNTETVRYLPAEMKPVAPGQLLGTFRWDGPRLMTRLVTDINKQAITVEEVRSLNPAGTEMTVELTLIVEHGYQSGGTALLRSQNAPNTAKGINVFVKK
jgi:hypothetical protein